jgi:DNA-binding transcriptional LysR family regulator
MDLKQLDTFRSVAKLGSLGRVAEQRGVTLSALSIQIKKLETELGASLFDHKPNRLVLTEKGRTFLREVDRVFEAVTRARTAVVEPTESQSGPVSIALATDAAKFFAPGIAGFVQRHPNLNVSILARPSRETLALVTSGEVDLGVGFFRKVPRGIVRKKICDTDIALVVPRGHPLERVKRPTLEDISAYRVIMRRRSSKTRRIIDAAFARYEVGRPNVLEVARCQSAMDFVELGLGIGLVHGICACAEPHKRLVQMDVSSYFPRTDVALIMRSGAVMSPAHKALIDAVIGSASARIDGDEE